MSVHYISRTSFVISALLVLVVIQVCITRIYKDDMQDLTLEGFRNDKNHNRTIITFKKARRHPHLLDAGVCLRKTTTSGIAHCFPSVICIGAMKAGTFELKQWLAEHPLVHPASSEQHFFGHGTALVRKNYVRYVTSTKEWVLPVRDIKRGGITFEKTPYYMASPVAALELAALLPSVRLIAMLRDPVARAYSSFYHHCDRNARMIESSPVQGGGGGGSAVVFNGDCHRVEHCCCGPLDDPPPTKKKRKDKKTRPPKIATCSPESFHRYISTAVNDTESPQLGTILRKGLYAAQIKNYLQNFSSSQLLVLDGKAFARDPSATMQRLFRFLGLGGHSYPDAVQNDRGFWYLKGKASKSNKQAAYKPMLPESRAWLKSFYETPDARLRSLVPDTVFSWMQ